MSLRRRRRNLTPVLTPVAFSDATDSIKPAGDPPFFRSSEAAPRSLVHRLTALDRLASGATNIGKGYGGRPESPIKSLRQVFRSPVVTVGVPGKRPLTPASQKRIELSWRAFNVLQAKAPASVRYCVRRKQRRETLFALDIAGRRGLGRRGVRRTENSNWSC